MKVTDFLLWVVKGLTILTFLFCVVFGVWSLVTGLPALLGVTCLSIAAITSVFIYNDVKKLLKKTPS